MGQSFGSSRLGAAKRSTLFVSHFFAFQPISMKFGMNTGYDVMCLCVEFQCPSLIASLRFDFFFFFVKQHISLASIDL